MTLLIPKSTNEMLDTFEDGLGELKEAKTAEEKLILLQKYGFMEPRLTEQERELCNQ